MSQQSPWQDLCAPQLLSLSEDQGNACCVKKTNCPHLDEPIPRTNETRAGEIITPPGNETIDHHLALLKVLLLKQREYCVMVKNMYCAAAVNHRIHPKSDLKHQLLSFYYYYYYHDISPSALSLLTRWPAERETMGLRVV